MEKLAKGLKYPTVPSSRLPLLGEKLLAQMRKDNLGCKDEATVGYLKKWFNAVCSLFYYLDGHATNINSHGKKTISNYFVTHKYIGKDLNNNQWNNWKKTKKKPLVKSEELAARREKVDFIMSSHHIFNISSWNHSQLVKEIKQLLCNINNYSLTIEHNRIKVASQKKSMDPVRGSGSLSSGTLRSNSEGSPWTEAKFGVSASSTQIRKQKCTNILYSNIQHRSRVMNADFIFNVRNC